MINNSHYRLYGRTKGRKNNKNNVSFLRIKLINIDHNKYNILDIGSGFGESTIKIAKKDKKKIVICCEKYIDGLNNLFKEVQKEQLDNVYIYQGNVHQMLDEYCSKNSLSEVWILFPDPWPKKRHHKRRLINEEFLHKIEKYMKKNCYLLISTDSTSYLKEILFLVYKIRNSFCWENQNIYGLEYQNNLIPQTKYYKKALKSGRNSFFIKLRKL